jgi:hypothetical protein
MCKYFSTNIQLYWRTYVKHSRFFPARVAGIDSARSVSGLCTAGIYRGNIAERALQSGSVHYSYGSVHYRRESV